MGATNFGARTDHFSLASTDLILIDSTITPISKNVERAPNEDNDYEDIESHGQNAGDNLSDISCTYELQSGTLNLNTLSVGELIVGTIAASLVATTANNAWPKIVVSGIFNSEAVTAPSGKLNTWTIPTSIILTGAQRAQTMDFAYDAGCRLTGSSYTAEVEPTSTTNGLGVVTAHGVSGGIATQTAELIKITVACAWTPAALTEWVETGLPESAEPQASWETSASQSATINITRDTSA